ncbi:MAG TPA: YicC/YloC family endoribonuclease [Kofleriaceae bacterium]|nr:YicC/YloC family endoribonuclease [Kofleriaceae bacterium]
MTGYGRGVAQADGRRATVEVRAVNHRFLDLKLRGAALSPALEEQITARVRAAVERGALAVSIHVAAAQSAASPSDGGGGGELASRIDPEAAQRAHAALAALAARLGTGAPDLALVLAQPGVVISAEPAGAEPEPQVLAALDAALAQLHGMRTTEGHALAVELRARLDELTALRAQIAALAAAVPEKLSKRLAERVRRLLDDAELDPGRLAQEVALLADRADITEELVRLVSHVEQARALLAAPGAVGRRLDFLVQEIGRELNTIGSKSTSAEISSLVVDAKAVLEKVREQVQNVE